MTGVTAAMVPALGGSQWGNDVAVEGFAAGPDTDSNARFNRVGPDYFRTMGIPLIAGREFTRADTVGAPQVAVVNEAFAKKFNLGPNPVGRRMGSNSGYTSKLDTEIVGLVQDAKYSRVKEDVPPLFFRPYRQDLRVGFMTFYVRTAADAEPFLANVPRVVAGLDATLPVEKLRTMEQQAAERVPGSTDRHAVGGVRRARHGARSGRAVTASSPTPSRSARGRLVCGWPSAPRRGRCAA